MSSPNKTRLQVSTNAEFTSVITDVDGAYTTEVSVPSEDLPGGVNLYVRAQHGHPENGISDWGEVIQFTIDRLWYDWNTSEFGLPFVFNTNAITMPMAVKLDATRVLVFFNNGTALQSAVVLTISGTTITKGTAVNIATLNGSSLDKFAVLMDANKVLVCYRDNANAGRGTANILSISGTTITVGTVHVFSVATAIIYPVMIKLTATTVLVVARVGDSTCQGVILTINGTTITSGGMQAIGTTKCAYPNLLLLDTSRVFLCFYDPDTAQQKYTILTISGDTITTNQIVIANTAVQSAASIPVKLNSGRIMVVHINSYLEILNVSGTTITTHVPALVTLRNALVPINGYVALNACTVIPVGIDTFVVLYSRTPDRLGCVFTMSITTDNSALIGDVLIYQNEAVNTTAPFWNELGVYMGDNRILSLFGNASNIGHAQILVG